VAEFDQAVAKFYTTDPSERDEWLTELHAVKKAIIKNNKARKGTCVRVCAVVHVRVLELRVNIWSIVSSWFDQM
jgi:hypothetical protein